MDKLDQELVGLKSVKNKIREMAALLLVDRIRKSLGLNAGAPSLHMTFLGNPGMGKTTVAMRMAKILYRLEYIRKENLSFIAKVMRLIPIGAVKRDSARLILSRIIN